MRRSTRGITRSLTRRVLVSSAPVLDTLPATYGAYSLRKLRTAYDGNAIQVRRSSDSAVQNIGFNADGTLNTSALASFIGSNDGTVVVWYDQSGSARDLSPYTGLGPFIISAGSLQLKGSRPSMNFSSRPLTGPQQTIYPFDNITVSVIASVNTPTVHQGIAGIACDDHPDAGNQIRTSDASNGQFQIGRYDGTSWVPAQGGTVAAGSALNLLTNNISSSRSSVLFSKGVQVAGPVTYPALSGPLTSFNIGMSVPGTAMLTGHASEFIIFQTELTTQQRTTLEANQTAYYSIT